MKVFLIIVSAACLIGGIVCSVLSEIWRQRAIRIQSEYRDDFTPAKVTAGKTHTRRLRKGAILLYALPIGFIILSQSFVIIPTGFTGVMTRMGQIREEGMKPGIHGKIPFVDSVITINNKQQDIIFEDQIRSETKDRTALYYANVTVTYQINPEKATWIYRNVTDYDKQLVTAPILASSIKSASKTLSDEEATKQDTIEQAAKEELQKALDEKYDPEAVTVLKVVIENADFKDSYNPAIADRQAAKLAYEKQESIDKQNVEKNEPNWLLWIIGFYLAATFVLVLLSIKSIIGGHKR